MGKNAVKIFKFEGCWKMKRQDPCVGKVGSMKNQERRFPEKEFSLRFMVSSINNHNHIHFVMLLVVAFFFFFFSLLF